MKADKSFGSLAKYYDLIYSDKDYGKEVDFLEQIFQNTRKPKKLLEIGCGTGNYTRILAERGYQITAVDISENMLKIAKEKCASNFVKGNIRDISIDDKFDTCIAMFAVIDYITDSSDLIKALVNIRHHLKPNGILVFDIWNGLAVLRLLPECRMKEAENDEMKIIRFATPTLRSLSHICEVDYKLTILNKERKTYEEIEEKHVVRFYFPQEMNHYLEEAGFAVLKVCPFLDLNGKVNENIWNIVFVAKAVAVKE
jgi:ubiquinone/menaquinone biosynthesis C-methylase UbiE